MGQRKGSGLIMWDWGSKTAREAREFAGLHALEFRGDDATDLPASADIHPFEGQPRRHCVSGEWRGRAVQRFSTAHITVEMMTLPGILPRLQVVPTGPECRPLALGGRAVAMGDDAFDSRWTVLTADPCFARAFLSTRVREALMHPAAVGRSLVVDGAALYLWAPGSPSWSEARVRFEFLSVVRGRLESDVWERFDLTPVAVPSAEDMVWIPTEEVSDVNQWLYAPTIVEENDEDGALGDTGEFEVSVLSAQLDGETFLPGHDDSTAVYSTWLVAPEVRA